MNTTENNRYIVQVYVGALSALYEALSVEASKQTTSEEIVSCIVERLGLSENASYELAEVIGDDFGQECKERSLLNAESPVQLMMLWPKKGTDHSSYRFYLREKANEYVWRDFVMDPQLIRDYFHRFLYQPKDREYPDLCQLPDLNEQTLLDNLRARFVAGHIYTYVGSILIALNPFKFYPIYNPKYVKLYQNRRLGPNLPPHIFAVADTAYHCMLKDRKNQCIVISGESGSGKTESTNFLLHHLTALSQKGSHGSGVEQTILSAGPVLEAFGNAKTAHNNNSSRFGKFIQVNYKENGMVHGAVVQKYLLEKSRICSQGRNERNYHVFYYLLVGANDQEKKQLHLMPSNQYHYLKSWKNLENVDESYEFSRLKQSMEMVGFTAEKQRRLFSVLSAVLLLGNVEFQPRKSAYHHDEAVAVKNPEVVALISELLRVKQETLMQALVAKRAKASGETLVINYRMPEAIASRDAMAKCLYGALFDWIVLQVNHALLSKKDTLREHQGNSIGVLDIFGFEDFALNNSFEQLCINYANEHLQYYFNQHVFKYEQEEYRKEGIKWTNIDFMDNTGCLQLIEGKPNGLLCLLDDQCNFPGATNETLLQKFNNVHNENKFYQKPQKKEGAFIIIHYAGNVKYQVPEMREKNLDLMRQDIVGVLKNSSMAFVRELVGADPVAVFRWAIVRAFFRSYFAFHEAGRKHRKDRVDGNKNNIQQRYQRNHVPNDTIISRSWPNFYQRNKVPLAKEEPPKRRRDIMGIYPKRSTIEQVFCPEEANVLHKANQIVMKNKSFRPRERGKKGLKNLQSVKTLAGRTASSGANQAQLGKARKQPMTVTAQFQQSLHSLMVTLNQANPFFIRCIKSNANKVPNEFDHDTVQRQLRYTGMLETVRIRQAGFNVRLTYDEFIQLYRILLPKGLLSSQIDVRNFLATLNLNRDDYQLGSTKVFLRETEKYKLDCKLHQQIMASIVTLQRWFRACLDRRRFLRIKAAATTLQACARMYIARKELRMRKSVVKIQRCWRKCKERRDKKFVADLVVFQAHCRGYKFRKEQVSKKVRLKHRPKAIPPTYRHLSDESFISKDSLFSKESYLSQEELLRHSLDKIIMRDSDEYSSGIPEDGDNESFHSKLSSTSSLPTVTSSCMNPIPPLFSYMQNKRNDDHVQEGILLETTLKRKIKAHKTIDYSDLESTLLSQGSNDSLVSHISLESQGSDSHYRKEPWIKQETSDFDTSATSSNNYSFNFMSEQSPVKNNQRFSSVKPQLVRTPPVMSPVKQLKSFPPVRRHKHDYLESFYPYDHPEKSTHTPNKTEQILGTPEAPVRNTRKSKRIHVKSLGEEVTDSGSIDKNPLSTISEFASANQRLPNKENIQEQYAQSTKLTPRRNRHIGLDLRRRNSDPATKTTLVSEHPSGVEQLSADEVKWQKSSSISISMLGHLFRKITKINKDDKCSSCGESIDEFLTQGYKCSHCKQLIHAKCIQNKKVTTCDPHSVLDSAQKARKKQRKHSRTSYDLPKPEEGNFRLTGTSVFPDRTDQIISDREELQLMQQFITNKIMKIEEDGKKASDVDRLFKLALREFKDNLVQIYSAHGYETCSLRYKDLICNFSQAMETVCQREQKEKVKDFPTTMGLNAFRGFMNEFMLSKAVDKPSKSKRKKEKKRKVETIKFKGHTFLLTIINIPTQCEICTSFFMWPIERGLICQSCKLTCHRKCYMNFTGMCLKGPGEKTGKLFGVPLVTLITEDNKIPSVIERLFTVIEVNGLYTEGIYRKSGGNAKIKELKQKLDENPSEVDFNNYQVHVLASVLKGFLREMPEPLFTFECYENFITAANLQDLQDRVATLYDILKKLPSMNYDLMERLMYHLARVALHEEVNRMSPASLAIVFAPCVLRTNKVVPAQDSLHDIANQTQCIETIIREQLKKVRSTLDDINTLDTACQAATNRLSTLRSSKVFTPEELLPANQPLAPYLPGDDEENILVDHIQEIRKEKDHLTSTLPTLTHATSDDDMLSTDGDGSMDDISCIGETKKVRGPVIRSISGGESPRPPSVLPKLKRQSSSDVSVKIVDDNDDPIMV